MNARAFTRIAAAIVVALTAGSCADEGFDPAPAPGTATATSLTITVTDGAYAPAESPDGSTPATRAVERGYGTEFTAGDRIGLYAVEIVKGKERKLRHENLCLTHDGTGWTLPAGTELMHCPPEGGEIIYLAYYPYQDDMTDKFSIDARKSYTGEMTTETRYFFRTLVNNWRPANDQSTYEAYTASDLMLAKGVVSKRTDGTDGSLLGFTMEHQMGLAVFRVPATKCTYTETITGMGTTEKSYHLYSGTEVGSAWKENSYTARILINIGANYIFNTSVVYYTNAFEKRRLKTTIPNDMCPPGTYYTYTIDGGQETVTERPLQAGDFYMKDGTVLPQEAFNSGNLPADVQKDCLGVVFWVKDPTQTDPILLRDHPACVHGLVLALKKSPSPCVWSNTQETVDFWTNASERGEDQVNIQQVNSAKGYANTKALRAYNVANPNKKVVAAEVAAQYPASSPEGSSGWFLPDLEDVIKIRKNFTDLENSIEKAGGDLSSSESYWSCFEMNAESVTVLYGNGSIPIIVSDKNNTHYVRAVLAF